MIRTSVVTLLLWAPLSSAFSPSLWLASRQEGVNVKRSPTLQHSSSVSDNNEDDNETYSIPDSAKFVIEVESGMAADFEAFGAFLSNDNNNETSSVEAPPPTDTTNLTNETSSALWTQLLLLASRTGRGEFASKFDKATATAMIRQLETDNPTASPTTSPLMLGTWELVYSSTQLFRSSPFFMAGRAICKDGSEAEQYDWFCDMHRKALAISNIAAVRQVVSSSKLVSEFEVKVGAVPFLGSKWPFAYSGGLPLTIDGAIVSAADITPTNNGNAWEIYMDTVEIKGSNIPGLRQVLDTGLNLSSRGLASVLESTISSYTTPKPIFTTTYLDENLRISRDQDDKVFVYAKVSNSTSPTDYSNVMADLGVSKLLEGFNDAVTKFYL